MAYFLINFLIYIFLFSFIPQKTTLPQFRNKNSKTLISVGSEAFCNEKFSGEQRKKFKFIIFLKKSAIHRGNFKILMRWPIVQ
jgi:hypothetical protein